MIVKSALDNPNNLIPLTGGELGRYLHVYDLYDTGGKVKIFFTIICQSLIGFLIGIPCQITALTPLKSLF